MSYYDIDGNLLDIDKENMSFLNNGECARVLHDGNITFKEYYSMTSPDYRLSTRMYNVLKDINNPHFIKLLNAYSQMSFLDLIKYKTGISKFHIDAYTALIYKDEEIDLLEKDKAYILDNLYELENLMDVFADNSIIVDDLKRDNVTMDSNSIVIIDPKTGIVEGLVDCRNLLPYAMRKPDTDVLNGIAWDEKTKSLYLTGKNWPKIFKISLTEVK